MKTVVSKSFRGKHFVKLTLTVHFSPQLIPAAHPRPRLSSFKALQKVVQIIIRKFGLNLNMDNFTENIWLHGEETSTLHSFLVSRGFALATTDSTKSRYTYLALVDKNHFSTVSTLETYFGFHLLLFFEFLSQHICEACGQTIPSVKDIPGPSNKN